MTNRLEPIILQKQREVEILQSLSRAQPDHMINQILQGKIRRNSNKSFKNALKNAELSIIAEIKRKSPSKGPLASIPDPVSLAKNYISSGANAISVLTDELFFGGKLEDLTQVSQSVQEQQIPILRKDFMIDKIQIAEAIMAGADAILCIVAVLGEEKTKIILDSAKLLGIEVLVEINNKKELESAIASGAEIIGVNNRDLTTMNVNTELALELIDDIPDNIIKIAASGILNPELA